MQKERNIITSALLPKGLQIKATEIEKIEAPRNPVSDCNWKIGAVFNTACSEFIHRQISNTFPVLSKENPNHIEESFVYLKLDTTCVEFTPNTSIKNIENWAGPKLNTDLIWMPD